MGEVPPLANWNELIDDVVAGRWTDPETGKAATVPFEAIYLAETLDGREAELVAPLKLGKRLAVVSDENTVEVLGRRVAKALRSTATIDEIVLPGDLEPDEATVARLSDITRHADGLVAVGSGALSDTCKYATFKDGRRYAAFGTAASMNGYAASTASITLASGLKSSLPAHAPRGIFLDLAVSARAPVWLSAAGLGDSLCRSTAQVDWWTSHRLFGTLYSRTPYALQDRDEAKMLATAPGISRHDLTANGYLQRVLTLCGLGVCFTHVSNHGSMGEHQVSHWIDMFAGKKHPGTVHGQQVGVASLAVARLQHKILAMESPPRIKATIVDEAGMLRRYGPVLAPLCIAESRKKAMDANAAAAFNDKLAELWPTLKAELRPMMMPLPEMRHALAASGGPVTAAGMGLDLGVWCDALRYAREIRGRWSFLDLAGDAGMLDDFLEGES